MENEILVVGILLAGAILYATGKLTMDGSPIKTAADFLAQPAYGQFTWGLVGTAAVLIYAAVRGRL